MQGKYDSLNRSGPNFHRPPRITTQLATFLGTQTGGSQKVAEAPDSWEGALPPPLPLLLGL